MFQKLCYKCNTLLLLLLSAYLLFLLLCYPSLSLQYALTGLELWLTKMVPALLPFIILSGIMMHRNLTQPFIGLVHPLLHRLFGTDKDGSYAVLMGFLCGFPMGARIVGELYGASRIDREEASYLLSFCNNIGPVYFLGYVLSELSITHGVFPFAVMYGIPLLYGFVLCRIRRAAKTLSSSSSQKPSHSAVKIQNPPASLGTALDESIVSGLIAVAKLGGYMIFFNLLGILFTPFPDIPESLKALYGCLLEITSGIHTCGAQHKLIALTLLPFGGFSCIAQTSSMICKTDLSLSSYLFHKLCQTCLTALAYVIYFVCACGGVSGVF